MLYKFWCITLLFGWDKLLCRLCNNSGHISLKISITPRKELRDSMTKWKKECMRLALKNTLVRRFYGKSLSGESFLHILLKSMGISIFFICNDNCFMRKTLSHKWRYMWWPLYRCLGIIKMCWVRLVIKTAIGRGSRIENWIPWYSSQGHRYILHRHWRTIQKATDVNWKNIF